jgi:RNA methyltransferase, TrmH family
MRAALFFSRSRTKTADDLITSPQNEKLKRIRKLSARRERQRTGLFVAEGEDLIAAASTAGAEPELLLVAGKDVEPALLAAASSLGSGSRVVGVYRQRWSHPGGMLSTYLQGVADPGNVGTIVRAAHAMSDGPLVLGPGCADPYSPKAVRASMGSVFSRPPARARLAQLGGTTVALDPHAGRTLGEVEVEPPVVVCLGAERAGIGGELAAAADATARIPMRHDAPDSLNVAMAATIALYELGNRILARA